ncbi:hypothetical protein BDR05DRAFT_477189 [Suillus weaverae]|nr:hypothetical protein BDR05DRAFT_477189 [Suillus weaverae]
MYDKHFIVDKTPVFRARLHGIARFVSWSRVIVTVPCYGLSGEDWTQVTFVLMDSYCLLNSIKSLIDLTTTHAINWISDLAHEFSRTLPYTYTVTGYNCVLACSFGICLRRCWSILSVSRFLLLLLEPRLNSETSDRKLLCRSLQTQLLDSQLPRK